MRNKFLTGIVVALTVLICLGVIAGTANTSTVIRQVQSDCSQTDNSAVDYLKNKTAMAPAYYNGSGAVTAPTKKWVGIITPNTGNGYSVDISSAGFASVMTISVMPVINTATATSVPTMAVKSVSNTAIVFNLVSGSAATTNVLTTLLGGLTAVLQGPPTVFANTTGVTFYLEVTGN